MRRPRSLVALLSLAALAFLGCSDATSPGPWSRVVATAKDGRVRVTNRTAKPAYTMVVSRELASRINWFQCVDPVQCPPIAPGDSLVVPYPSVSIPEGEKEALVYWWHASTGPADEAVPGALKWIVVRL